MTPAEQKRYEDTRLDESFRHVMSDPKGRHLIWWMMERAKVFSPCFTGNSTTFYNEGRREIGLEVFERAAKHRELFTTMQDEKIKEQN